ncbi:NAC domain containing protein 85 [Wolffia australiana]
MAKAWLINSRGLAKKVKNPTALSKCAISDLAAQAIRQCPNCQCRVDNSDVSLEWPGLPAGVKFDPTDAELLEHLAGKVGIGESKAHIFIDEFIPTLEEDEGICYTHPENLPGVKKDGSSSHFFYKTSNAYSTGQRKRRKIQKSFDFSEDHVRWHKTGKTRPVIENGVQRGVKKIMVLYKSSRKGLKPTKTNWVMHQYHLGTEEDERDGQVVVAKIFYQTQLKQSEEISPLDSGKDDLDNPIAAVSPTTPKTSTPKKLCRYDEGDEDKVKIMVTQGEKCKNEEPQISISNKRSSVNNSVVTEFSEVDDDLIISLVCDEVLDPLFPPEEPWSRSQIPFSWNDVAFGKENWASNFPDLDGIDTSTPPDFNLADLQFGSQDSFMSWLDRI